MSVEYTYVVYIPNVKKFKENIINKGFIFSKELEEKIDELNKYDNVVFEKIDYNNEFLKFNKIVEDLGYILAFIAMDLVRDCPEYLNIGHKSYIENINKIISEDS